MSPSVELQPRDMDLLGALFHCRIMTLAHAVELFFAGKAEMGKKRVQKLKAAGYLRERSRAVFERSVLSLAPKGIVALRDDGKLAEYSSRNIDFSKRMQVSDFTIAHEHQVMDVQVAFHRQIQTASGWELVEFGTWPSLYEFETEVRNAGGWLRRQIVRPDGFCRIANSTDGGLRECSFFIELDRSTETQERIASRCGAYQSFFRSGGFAEWFGANPEDYKEFPFRVLVILQNAERRNNLLHFCLQQKVPIHQLVWTTTLDEIHVNPFGQIWLCPIDYARALEGTRFDPDKLHQGYFKNYRRQIERELAVESRAVKRLLIENRSES